MESFEQACSTIATKFRIPCASGQDYKEASKDHFTAHGKWLIILDHMSRMGYSDGNFTIPAEELAASILKFLPQNEEGCILFTTRASGINDKENGKFTRSTLYVGSMLGEEVKVLLGTLLQDKVQLQQHDVNKLLRELDNLPMAIAEASAFMNNLKPSISIYLQCLNHDEVELHPPGVHAEYDCGSELPVKQSLNVRENLARIRKLTGDARQLASEGR